MSATLRPLTLLAVVLGASACTTELPAVAPDAFACSSDAPLASGELPCPEDAWCSADPCVARRDCPELQEAPAVLPTDLTCTPRLGCLIPSASRAGCDPEGRCGTPGFDCLRCEAVLGEETAAVRCEGGIHTATSAPPLDPERCECPDGTFCAVYADTGADLAPGPEGAFPLYVLPPGAALPAGMLGIRAEVPGRKVCVRGCGSELDCPGGHTCRAAAVVNGGLLAGGAGRSTIGACWPDLLTTTSTQPDPRACREHAGCPAPGMIEPCRFTVITVPDHPSAPIGASFGPRLAIAGQCATTPLPLQDRDEGCTKSSDCKSGICREGRCTIPCDPGNPDVCAANRGCGDFLVLRDLPNGEILEDRVTVCGDR